MFWFPPCDTALNYYKIPGYIDFDFRLILKGDLAVFCSFHSTHVYSMETILVILHIPDFSLLIDLTFWIVIEILQHFRMGINTSEHHISLQTNYNNVSCPLLRTYHPPLWSPWFPLVFCIKIRLPMCRLQNKSILCRSLLPFPTVPPIALSICQWIPSESPLLFPVFIRPLW